MTGSAFDQIKLTPEGRAHVRNWPAENMLLEEYCKAQTT